MPAKVLRPHQTILSDFVGTGTYLQTLKFYEERSQRNILTQKGVLLCGHKAMKDFSNDKMIKKVKYREKDPTTNLLTKDVTINTPAQVSVRLLIGEMNNTFNTPNAALHQQNTLY